LLECATLFLVTARQLARLAMVHAIAHGGSTFPGDHSIERVRQATDFCAKKIRRGFRHDTPQASGRLPTVAAETSLHLT
jgi:hypothetical protein